MRGVAELREIVAADALKLGEELARLGPFAILAEGNLARDGREFMGMDVVGELGVIETFRRLDRLRQNLAGGIGMA